MAPVWFPVLLCLICCTVCTGILPPPTNLISVCPAFNSSVCLYAKARPECNDDSQCTDSKKCCCSSNCGLKCVVPEVVKTGRCPNILAKCSEKSYMCDSDINCFGIQKCCNICGRNCWDPEKESGMVCPKNDEGQSVSLQCNLGTCTRDSDCKMGEKCCATTNGPSCVKAIKVKDGQCPNIKPKCRAELSYDCKSDCDCPGSKKCCNICGRTCRDAVSV